MSKSILLKSALWVTFSEIIFNLSGFIIHSALGRILGPADYGRYGLVITLTTMIIILIGNGIPTAMAKYISEYFETNPRMVRVIKKQAVALQTTIIGLVTVLFFILSPVIANLLNDPTLTELFQVSTLIIPTFAAASFYFSYYTGLHRFNVQATLKTIRSILRIGLAIGLAYIFGLKGSISAYILAPASVFLIAFAIDKFKISRELGQQEEQMAPSQEEEKFDWRILVNYAWQVVVFFLAYELLISIDLYMVKALLRDDRLTGIYNAALTVGRIPYYIFYAMTVFLLPMVSKSTSQNNHTETKMILSQSLRIMLLFLVPMIVILAYFSGETLRLLYGSRYAEGAAPMSILVYGVGFLTLFYVMTFAMNGAGKTKLAMWISLFGVVLNTALNYLLIKKMGLSGSAIATSLTSLVIAAIMLYCLWKEFGVGLKIRSVANAATAGAVVYFLAGFLPQGRIIFLLWSVLLFLLYFIILFALREIGKSDLEYLMNLKKKRQVEDVEEKLSGNEPSA